MEPVVVRESLFAHVRYLLKPSPFQRFFMLIAKTRAKETVGWFMYGKPMIPSRWIGDTIKIRRPPKFVVRQEGMQNEAPS